MMETTAEPQIDDVDWKEIVRKYQRPSFWRGLWQICNTLVPFAALWVGAYFMAGVSLWLVLPLALLAGMFLVRTFIIFHDCTHGSFFKSKRANDVLGFVTGVLTFTPYDKWKFEHAHHHSSAGDLDRRGMGDVWTLTVQEYLEAPRWKRILYRVNRNPFVLFGLAPLILFVVLHRLPAKDSRPKERRGVHMTNLALAVVFAGLVMIYGWQAALLMQLISIWVASTVGVWLFYVQHQFEDVYWDRTRDWEFEKVAMEGSSFYKLPKVLQWFSGNIGFHHIHHLSPRIPNYRLEKAHEAEQMFQAVEPMTIKTSLESFHFRLWDETKRRLVGYKAIKGRPRRRRDCVAE